MDPASNWGEQGGADEAPTRLKLLAGASSRSASTRSRMLEIGFEVPKNGNWHGEEKEGLTGLDGLLEGEVDMEDDDVLVLEEEEEEEQPPEVWRLRTGVNFAPMGKNWFKITLYSQGDFNFVSQGGPWIYRGYPLLVAKVQGERRPSETVLNTVPLWVYVYDMPWNRQKKGTAMLIGGKLGKYLEADLDAEGKSPYDFLRVRVEIPIDRRLQQSITTQYDSRLRCSPVRKFECRQAYGPPQQHPHVRKGLNFSSSDENSTTLGTPTDRRRNSNVVRHTGNHIPTRVDAWDGFEEQEKEGSVEVDNELANKINHMNLPLVRVGEGSGMVKSHKKSAVRTSHSRGTSRGAGRSAEAEKQLPDVIENLIPIAMYPVFPSASYLAGLGSEEMIPPERLRPLLGEVISENQSAFVPGRLITDNALLAFECLHYMEHGAKANNSFCAYKLDLSKAYDRVDWVFLEDVMHKMGFAHQWVRWIMLCVTTVRYSVKLNGALLEAFTPTRGLRQGDPLSPFLFLFIADGLSELLRAEVEAGGITPVKVCRNAPGISHLLFADDTLLFFRAEEGEASRVRQVIENYAASTGQLVNDSKCSIQFSKRCPMELQLRVSEVLNIQKEGFEDKYLGLPTPDGRMNKGKFQMLQEQLAKRILLWNDLSQGGKEIMIKAVAQSLATYIMGVFKLPLSVCDDLTKLVRDFWWVSSNGARKTH
ncbi:hypothetical protein ACQ4PT_063778 [Festuca glaucescens]